MSSYIDNNGIKVSDFSLFMDVLLHTPVEYENGQEEHTCQLMMAQLSEDERNLAANTSYVYWFASQQLNLCLDSSTRDNMAMKEVFRHLQRHNGSFHNALVSLRRSLFLRQRYGVELLRTLDNPEQLRSSTNNVHQDQQKSKENSSKYNEHSE